MYLPNHLYKIGGTSLKNTLFFPYTPIFTPPSLCKYIHQIKNTQFFIIFFDDYI